MKRTYRQLPGGGFMEVTPATGQRSHALHTREGLKEQREASLRGVGSVHDMPEIMQDAERLREYKRQEERRQRKADIANVVRWASVSGIEPPRRDRIRELDD